MRPYYLLPAAVLAVACLSACDPKTDFPAIVALATPPSGPAPAWRLRDPDGNVVSSDQFKGKVVVLDFGATWCAPCRIEIPGYVALQKKYGGDGLVIIAALVDQPGPGAVKKFIADFGINYPVVMADDDIVNAFGGVDALPDDRSSSTATESFGTGRSGWRRPQSSRKNPRLAQAGRFRPLSRTQFSTSR